MKLGKGDRDLAILRVHVLGGLQRFSASTSSPVWRTSL
jgi:hypothetical protein